MSEPRFYVRELTGLPIPLPGQHLNARSTTSFYILDRLYNCEVVETWENAGRRTNLRLSWLRGKADERCAQLNRWWETELARG